MDCRPLFLGSFAFSACKVILSPCSLVETSRLKRSATFSWTRFLRYHLLLSPDLEKGIFQHASFQGYIWSSWHICVWLFSHPTTDWHKQIHNRWVGHAHNQICKAFSPPGRLRPHFLTVCRPNITLTSTQVQLSFRAGFVPCFFLVEKLSQVCGVPSDPVYVTNYGCLGEEGIEEAEREVGRKRWNREAGLVSVQWSSNWWQQHPK